MMAKTIGGDGPSREKKCAHCGDQFGWPELNSFFIKLRGNTVRCIVCTEDNYLVSDTNMTYYLIAAAAFLIGIIVFLLCNFAIAAATYSSVDGSFRISGLGIIGGAVLGAATCRLILRIYHWKTGFFSTDKNDKSMADYE